MYGNKRTTIKTPKCPKCINPRIRNYYSVGKMKKVYERTQIGSCRSWKAVGWFCQRHKFFIPIE